MLERSIQHPLVASRWLWPFVATAVLTGCSDNSSFSFGQESPLRAAPEKVSQVQQHMPHCVVDLAGIGDPGQGWSVIRKDNSLWRTPWGADPAGHPSAERDPFFHDNVLKLVDIDGEALSNCAITSDNRLWCWGANDRGQLGDGTKQDSAVPVEVKGLGPHVVQVGMSHTYGCALKDDGTVWCWGGNDVGQLGTLNTQDSLAPVQVGIGNDNEYVSVGFEHVCVKKTNGDLWCWGENGYAETGVGNVNNPLLTPTKVMSNVKKVSAGGFFTCVIKTDDSLWCWGDNADGHVGVNSNQGIILHPTKVATLGNNVTDVDASVRAACAITKDGAVWCWGWPDRGRLGDGQDCCHGIDDGSGKYKVLVPQRVHGPLGTGGAKRILTREVSACAITTDDEIWCWGAGLYPDGQDTHLEPVKTDFCSLPDLRGLSPEQGPAKGGNTVTLTGTDFQDGAKVFFDGQPAKFVSVVDSTKVEAEPPSHEPGTVDVMLVNPGKHPARLIQSYTFVLGPTFDNVAPNAGPLSGGTEFTLSGSGFTGKVTVSFGGKPASDIVSKDDSTITGKTPAFDKAGVVDVIVTNEDKQVAIGKGAFTYVAPPVLSSIEPNTGPADGGNSVVITGDGFTWDTIIRFDGQQAGTNFEGDATKLTVSPPEHVAGTVDVTAEDIYGQLTTLAAAYTYTGTISNGVGGSSGSEDVYRQGGDVPFGVWSCATSLGSHNDGRVPNGGALLLVAAASVLVRKRR